MSATAAKPARTKFRGPNQIPRLADDAQAYRAGFSVRPFPGGTALCHAEFPEIDGDRREQRLAVFADEQDAEWLARVLNFLETEGVA